MSHITNRLAVEEAFDEMVGRRPNRRRIAVRRDRPAERARRPGRPETREDRSPTSAKDQHDATR